MNTWNSIIKLIDEQYGLLHDIASGGLTYGTAGFRTKGSILHPVMARLIVIAALRGVWWREKKKVAFPCMGLMITASHNPHEDNGFKILDCDGKMLCSSWEKWCTNAVNTPSGSDFFKCISECCEIELSSSPEEINFGNVDVLIGSDTRESGEVISKAASKILSTLNVKHQVFKNVSTPQLHHVVLEGNANPSGINAGHFVESLINSFNGLFGLLNLKPEKKTHIVIDTANGVGSVVLKHLLKLPEANSVLHKYFTFDLLNTSIEKHDALNHECGADFVNRKHEPSQDMMKAAEKYNNGETHFYCIDGDADRVVAFDNFDGKWTLLNGDRILLLYAIFVSKIFGPELVQKMDIGIVQTAYANSTSTAFAQEQLKLKTYLGPTGVKNIHPIAEKRDIGLYFEANGHGTILFNKKRVEELCGPEKASLVELLSTLVSQVCGDAIGDLLLCEIALAFLKYSFRDWGNMYKERPALEIKVHVPFPQRVTTTPAEARALTPPGLQDDIDFAVQEIYEREVKANVECPFARSFSRASGTEPIVRVYSEASTPDSCKLLSDRVCELIQRYCS